MRKMSFTEQVINNTPERKANWEREMKRRRDLGLDEFDPHKENEMARKDRDKHVGADDPNHHLVENANPPAGADKDPLDSALKRDVQAEKEPVPVDWPAGSSEAQTSPMKARDTGPVAPTVAEPSFFAQRNPKVEHPRGKDRRVSTVERRAASRRLAGDPVPTKETPEKL